MFTSVAKKIITVLIGINIFGVLHYLADISISSFPIRFLIYSSNLVGLLLTIYFDDGLAELLKVNSKDLKIISGVIITINFINFSYRCIVKGNTSEGIIVGVAILLAWIGTFIGTIYLMVILPMKRKADNGK